MCIEQEILTALETYQWTTSAVIYNFATHLNYSESVVRLRLGWLVDDGKIEKVVDGTHLGKPRFIYRLKKCSDVK